MLKLVEENQIDEILNFLESQGAIATRIGAYLKCYRTKMDFVYFWVQTSDGEITSVVSKVDGNMTVCTTDKTDFEEVREFFNVIGYITLFMSASDFKKTGIIPDKTGDILCFAENPEVNIREDIVTDCDLKRAFELFSNNRSESISALDYLPWLSDFTYKRNRNSARIIGIAKDGSQICFAMTSAETEHSALISGVVTDRAYRKRGYASCLVTTLADELKRENKSVYIMTATENNKKFYENNGFVCVGRWGTVDRKI